MDGKTVIVTGATSGIGKETARALARLGAAVCLVGRDPERGRAALAELRPSARHPEQMSFAHADFASLDEVRALGRRLAERFATVDVLINNAAVINRRRRLTEDGLEATLAVNHLAPFLLTGLLLPRLRQAPQGRIVTVASSAHLSGRIDLDDLQSARRYSGFSVYAASKLANMLFTLELARRLERTTVTVNAMHPGVVAGNFAGDDSLVSRLAMTAFRPLLLSPAQGAETAVYLATEPRLATVTGRYFYRNRQQPPSSRARDTLLARNLWRESEKLTGFSYGSELS